jgi:hypothetical protein
LTVKLGEIVTIDKEQVLEWAFVLEHRCGKFMRQREDNMEVRHGQKLKAARGQPLGASVSLALGGAGCLIAALSCTFRKLRQ